MRNALNPSNNARSTRRTLAQLSAAVATLLLSTAGTATAIDLPHGVTPRMPSGKSAPVIALPASPPHQSTAPASVPSRSELADESPSEAASTANQYFGDVLAASVPDVLASSSSGTHVIRTLGDHALLVRQPGSAKRSVAYSVAPAQAHGAPVDLSLHRNESGYAPVNSSAAVELPATADGAISMPAAGVTLHAATDNGSAQRLSDGTTLFYAGAGRGTSDLLANPVPSGLELSWQLRDLSNSLTQTLRVDLPSDGALHNLPDGSVEIQRQGMRQALIAAPSAIDAHGNPVPVSMHADGDLITITASPSPTTVAPVLVDPVIQQWSTANIVAGYPWNGLTADPTGANTWWFWVLGDTSHVAAARNFPANIDPYFHNYGDGLYFWAAPGSQSSQTTGQWDWWAPGQTSYISRADIGSFDLSLYGGQETAQEVTWADAALYSMASNGAVGDHWLAGSELHEQQLSIAAGDTNANDLATTDPTQARVFAFAVLQASPNAPTNHWSEAHMDNVVLYLDDPESPTVQATPDHALPTNPVANYTANVAVTASDPGLGVSRTELRVDGSTKTTIDENCSGARDNLCPASVNRQIALDTSSLDDGHHTLSVVVTDATGKQTISSLGTVDLDRTMHDQRSYDAAGRVTADQFSSVSGSYAEIDDARDPAGRVSSTQQSDLPGDATTDYTFDTIGRLSSANGDAYDYTAAGDPTTQAGVDGFTYDNADELLTAPATTHTPATNYSYDDVGRRKQSVTADGHKVAYQYDTQGRLRSVHPSADPDNSTSGNIAEIAGGAEHTLALENDGSVVAWGNNSLDQLGDRDALASADPHTVPIPSAAHISARQNSSLAVLKNHTIVAWGDNSFGQLGTGVSGGTLDPTLISGLTDVQTAALGGYHGAAVKSDGTVWTWGTNFSGQLGDGTTNDRPTPSQVPGLTNVTAVSLGLMHTLALKDDGTVWAWGANPFGAIGNGTVSDALTPIQVPGLHNITAIATTGFGSYALKSDGSVWHWGLSNSNLDMANLTTSMNPEQVDGLPTITKIAAGDFHVLALASNHSVYAWGLNDHGQIATGDTVSSATPQHIDHLADVTDLAAGAHDSFALEGPHTIDAWGQNDRDQLGDGSGTDQTNPSSRPAPSTTTSEDNTPTTYSYDGDGLRVGKAHGAHVDHFTWTSDALPRLLSDGHNDFIYGPDGVPFEQINADGSVAFLHHDQLGSIRATTSQHGTVTSRTSYSPTGVPQRSGDQITPFGYAGEYTDKETGLQYLRARYYDPATNQFLTRDPIEDYTHQTYQYAMDDPIDLQDPTGLCSIPVICPIVSTIGSSIRPPDYITLGGGFIGELGGGIGTTFTVTRDGNVYWDGLDADFGVPGISSFIRAGWINQLCKPTDDDINNFVSSLSVTGSSTGPILSVGYTQGNVESTGPGSGATEIGFGGGESFGGVAVGNSYRIW